LFQRLLVGEFGVFSGTFEAEKRGVGRFVKGVVSSLWFAQSLGIGDNIENIIDYLE